MGIHNFKCMTEGNGCLLMLGPFSATPTALKCPQLFSEIHWTNFPERGADASHLSYDLTASSKLLGYNSF